MVVSRHSEAGQYQRRVVDDELDALLAQLPAIALEGPRGVGKTATAERRAVDRGCAPGSFLLTDPAAPVSPPSHSGAGRIVTLRMRPMALFERGFGEAAVSFTQLLSGARPAVSGNTAVRLADYVDEIVRSGLPGIRTLQGRALRLQLDGYLRRIVDSDFQELGHVVRRPQVLERWMAVYAAATATTATLEAIRDAATGGTGDKPAKTTTQPYREILERIWVVDPVPTWLPTRNRLNRLSQLPKHHLADPALAARALGLDADALLSGATPEQRIPRDGSVLGHLFESLVTQGVRVFAQAADARVSHLRTQGGRQEIDLIVERADQRVLAIAVKLGGVVGDDDVKHLLWLRQHLGDDFVDAVVVNTGPQAYRRPDGIAVVPAALLGP